MIQNESKPKFLYKIVSPKDWQESKLQGHIIRSSIDQEFIHLATQDQISHVIQKFWGDQGYVILKLDTEKLKGRLVLEVNPGGTNLYYHLYEGSIPLDAVQDVVQDASAVQGNGS